jgi:hypothetical protein
MQDEILGVISGKMKAYLKAKIEETETNSKKKISGTCIGASLTSRRVTSLELTW